MKLLSLIKRLVEFLRRKYIWLFEWYSILRKRKLYKDIRWTKEQQREFDAFWKANYGRTISNRWHKLYQCINGHFDIQYFPEVMFTSRLEPRWNRIDYCKVLKDKGFLYSMYGRLDCMRLPKNKMLFAGKYCYDEQHQIVPKEVAMEKLADVGPAVLKPTVAHGSGRNVIVVDFQNGVDKVSGKAVVDILQEYRTDFVVQERIKPHPQFAKIYPKSINTLKILTYILDGKLYHAPICLRIGSGGSWLDNIHAGGFCIAVKDDGTLGKYAYRLGYCDSSERADRHPDTGFVYEGAVVPGIPKLIKAAYTLHGLTPNLGSVAWDFCLDEDGMPVLIEANYKSNSIWFPQVSHEQPVFGENTACILQFLKRGYLK